MDQVDVAVELVRTASLAADAWVLTQMKHNTFDRMTPAEQTRGIIRTGVLHLIEQGLIQPASAEEMERRFSYEGVRVARESDD